jgi:hypothetical protein
MYGELEMIGRTSRYPFFWYLHIVAYITVAG